MSTASPEAGGESPTPDDLDREQLGQLHAMTLQISTNCFELKKLCATVLVPTGTLVAVFTNRRLNAAVFVAGLLVIVAFWLADSVSFYYGCRLRAAMYEIWRRRASRCAKPAVLPPEKEPVSRLRSLFDASMLYYLILGMLVLLVSGIYSLRLIGH